LWSKAGGVQNVGSGPILTGFAWSADCASLFFGTRSIGRTTAASVDRQSGRVTELQSVNDVTARVVWQRGSPIFFSQDTEKVRSSLALSGLNSRQPADSAYVENRNVYLTAAGRTVRVSSQEGEYSSVKLSPDRTHVFYSEDAIGLEVTDLRDGLRVQLPEVTAADWFPDSRRLLVAKAFDDGERVTSVVLGLHDIGDGSDVPVGTPSDYRGWDFAIAPDGRTLAYVSDGLLHIAEIRTPR
jgi:hypothetical protein